MKTNSLSSRLLILILFSLLSASLSAQENAANPEFKPHVGQEGKDVIWVPTPDGLVAKMLEIGKVTDKDILIDLGSGDGRTVIAAAKIGAKALGIEYNPDMVALSEKNASEAGVSDRAKFIKADLFEYDFSEATVITMFLLPDINLKLRPRLLDLKPGTRIVSNTFTMGEWEPDVEATTEENYNSWYTALLWVIPAKVSGTWNLDGNKLELTQQYQMIHGTLTSGNSDIKITDGRLNGESITFTIGSAKYTGQVVGNKKMSGTATSGSGSKEWVAAIKSESK